MLDRLDFTLYHCSSYCPRIIKLYRSCHKTILFNGKYSVSCRFGVRDSTDSTNPLWDKAIYYYCQSNRIVA